MAPGKRASWLPAAASHSEVSYASMPHEKIKKGLGGSSVTPSAASVASSSALKLSAKSSGTVTSLSGASGAESTSMLGMCGTISRIHSMTFWLAPLAAISAAGSGTSARGTLHASPLART